MKNATTNIWSLSRTMCWWKKVSEQWVHHHLSCQRRSRWDNIVGRGANTSWTSSAHLLLSLNPSPCEPSRPSSAFSTCVCLQVGWGEEFCHKCCQKLRQTKDAFTLCRIIVQWQSPLVLDPQGAAFRHVDETQLAPRRSHGSELKHGVLVSKGLTWDPGKFPRDFYPRIRAWVRTFILRKVQEKGDECKIWMKSEA